MEGSTYYIVHESAMPPVLKKVAEANRLLSSGKARTVNEAAEMVGIGRSSYYKFKDSVEPYEVMTLIQQKVSSKLRELVTQLPKNEGVSYMYYKSPLVKAIENGWMIEIQEFNVVKEAALFTSLNNVFDKDSNGILETPYGQVLRH